MKIHRNPINTHLNLVLTLPACSYVSLHFDEIKEHVHSIAVQALAGGTISSLKTQIAFITTVVDNLPTNFLNGNLTH